MLKQTPLYQQHLAEEAKIVDFFGWAMPLHYGSQLNEHRAVRSACGVFDVSHMGVVECTGAGARDFLRYVLANDVDRLQQPGKALYSCMLNQAGGVLDDLICYFLGEGDYRLVINAGRRDADMAWLQQHAQGFDVQLNLRSDLAMLAVQGPQAPEHLRRVLPEPLAAAFASLAPFQSAQAEGWFIGRTGYTGEDGGEIILPATAAADCWRALRAGGVAPCGLGARDSLRLEAGLNLYGQDMDERTTPLESNLGWTVAWEPEQRQFIGRDALTRQRAEGVPRRLLGLQLEGRGVLRQGQRVEFGASAGVITSGTYSPVLNGSIALARVDAEVKAECGEVEIRGRRLPVRRVKPPFVRKGKV